MMRSLSMETLALLAGLLHFGASYKSVVNPIRSQRFSSWGRSRYRERTKPLQVSTDVSDTIASQSFDWSEQWYPVAPISYLDYENQKPTAVTVLGRQLVVWKNDESESSGWSILKDSCLHRRSPLSTGQVVKNGSTNCIMCRYHGWEFDSTGRCTKIPMDPSEGKDQQPKYPYRVASFPNKVAKGLLWVYLGKVSKSNALPEIPTAALPSDDELSYGSWDFGRFPISFLSLVENSFDPAHALFTHQSMADFGSGKYSPDDALPIVRYDLLEKESENGGFTFEHTTYQRSVAEARGATSTTTRSFIPPCTIKTASGSFGLRIWFVPSTPTETNILSIFFAREPKIVKVARKLPKVKAFLTDCYHTAWRWGDNYYRFQSQDRITMQGQDERKPLDRYWWDLTPTPSDAGVAKFQRWIRTVGGLGPFPNVTTNSVPSRELSFWDSHAKYCPECRRTIKRVAAVENVASKLSTKVLLASAISSLLAGIFAIGKREGTSAVATLSIMCLVAAVGFRWLSEWAKNVQRRVYADGGDIWQKKMEIFGYSNNGNQP